MPASSTEYHARNRCRDYSYFRMGTENLDNLNSKIPCENHAYKHQPKPISFTNYYVHRHHKRNILLQSSSFGKIKHTHPRGLIFIWPQRRSFYYERELKILSWFLAHALFWLHITNLFPSGTGIPINQPKWIYKPALPKPENRDYIIEPDWDSIYQ